MFARSTDIDRTYSSAENLLSTLFTPSSLESVYEKLKRGIEVSDVINIWTIEKGKDDLDVEQNEVCPLLKQRCAELMSSSDWGKHNQSIVALKKKVATGLNVPVENIPDIFLVLEILRARRAQGIPVPGIDEVIYKAVETAATWELVTIYNDSLVHTLTSGQILQEMVGIFQNVISGTSKRKFTLYAAHDTTVAPLLLALGIQVDSWPAYASNVYLGLWKDMDTGNYFLETLYDRQPVTMFGCPVGAFCPFTQFVSVASKSFIQHRNKVCQGTVATKFDSAPSPIIDFLC